MPTVTIRNVTDETHRALKTRAARNGRSTEAEIRAILDAAVLPQGRLLLGSALSALSRSEGLTNADLETLDVSRVLLPAEPMMVE